MTGESRSMEQNVLERSGLMKDFCLKNKPVEKGTVKRDQRKI